MNKAWHEQHKMPKGASIGQRVAWHQEHQKHCGCRPIPASLLPLLRARRTASASRRVKSKRV